MNVEQLIAELQKMPPQLECRVLLTSIMHADELGEREILLEETDAIEAYEVAHYGGYVLITSK
jgi:hypothetical protein